MLVTLAFFIAGSALGAWHLPWWSAQPNVGSVSLIKAWGWAPALLDEAAVRELARGWFAALEALVRHAAQPGAGGRSPSDLPLVALSQAEIERLERIYAD